MKRILGMVVAVAGVLAFSSAAMAAPVVFDLTGVTGQYSRSSDIFAADPIYSGGPCPTSMVAEIPNPGGCFHFAYGAGSSVSVDIDGTDVMFLGATINVHAVAVVASGTIVLTTDYVSTLTNAGGGGVLDGDTILWNTGAADGSVVGTLTCTTLAPPFPGDNPPGSGSNCGLVGLPPGVTVPAYPALYSITNSTPVHPLDLGWWVLNGAHDSIIKSALVQGTTTNNVDEPNPTSSAFTFANSVPEPSAAALVLLGLGALALRSRKA
jgi:hypothetical protein